MPLKQRAPGKLNRKTQIVAAAEKLMTQKGLAGVTTRAVADTVPCSEGAIYVHFRSRMQLLLTVLEHALPEMLVPLQALDSSIGKSTPRANLVLAFKGLRKFHDRVAPMVCSLFAETDLLREFRHDLAARGKGPQGGVARIVRYLREEQRTGRVSTEIDPEVAAATLMSVSFFQAFTRALLGTAVPALAPGRVVDFALQSGRSRK